VKSCLITSFQRSLGVARTMATYSAAVYQPKGFNYPKADWTDIRDVNGKWIRPREFMHVLDTDPTLLPGVGVNDPLKAYHNALLHHYAKRFNQIEDWLSIFGSLPFVLCCWCPYERAAQRQIKEHGSYVCHTAVLGEVLEEHGVQVFYDSDRRLMKVLP